MKNLLIKKLRNSSIQAEPSTLNDPYYQSRNVIRTKLVFRFFKCQIKIVIHHATNYKYVKCSDQNSLGKQN